MCMPKIKCVQAGFELRSTGRPDSLARSPSIAVHAEGAKNEKPMGARTDTVQRMPSAVLLAWRITSYGGLALAPAALARSIKFIANLQQLLLP